MFRLSLIAATLLIAACSSDSPTGVTPLPPPPPPSLPHPAIYPRPQSRVGVSARIVGKGSLSDVVVENWRADSTVYALDSVGDNVDVMLNARVINTQDSTGIAGDTVIWQSTPNTDAWAFTHHDTPGLMDTATATDSSGYTAVEFKFPASRFASDADNFMVITATLKDSTGAVNTVAKFYLIKSHDAQVIGFYDGQYVVHLFNGNGGQLVINPNVPYDMRDHVTFNIISGADLVLTTVAIDSVEIERKPRINDPYAINTNCMVDSTTHIIFTCNDSMQNDTQNRVDMFLSQEHADVAPIPIFMWLRF